MMDEGYIKFKIDWQKGPAPNYPEMEELIAWRDRMYDLGLIGHDQNHDVGFGNISLLPAESNGFVISGTQTGHIERLGAEHFTEVIDYSIDENRLTCFGPIKASSESLTHAAIYEADPNIRAIIHIHHDQQWAAWLDKIPTTSKAVPYGTPEMAREIHKLFEAHKSFNLLAMAGHQGGIIAFGENLEEAAKPLLATFG